MLNLNRFNRRGMATCLSLLGLTVFSAEGFAQTGAKPGTEGEAQGETPVSLLPDQLIAQADPEDESAVPDEAVESPDSEASADEDSSAEVALNPPEDKVETVQVTGTRIRRADLTTPAPVTVLDTQQINAAGLVSVGDILQNLPQNANGLNVQFNNGGTGATRVNLRGLGAERTLVLLNGRRIVPGGFGADASVDLNIIPVNVIERMEILRDGASAVYGSDAIGGVVNIITKKDFSGVEANAFYQTFEDGGPLYQASVTVGDVSERSMWFVNGQYFRQEPLWQGEVDYFESDTAYDFASGNVRSDGSSAPPQGNLFPPGGRGNSLFRNLRGNGQNGPLYNDPAAGWRSTSFGGASDLEQGDLYDFAPQNYLVTPSERFSLFSSGEYLVTDNLKVYVEGLYQNRQSDRILAPEPIFGVNLDTVVATRDGIYNPFGADFGDFRRRMIEQSNRRFEASSHVFRVVAGFEYQLPDTLPGKLSTWSADFNFNFGRTESTETSIGLLWRRRLADAVGPSFIDQNLVARCGTPDAPIAGCVPLNVFGGEGTITDAMLDYVTWDGVQRGFSEQRVLTFEIGGEVFDLWNRPVSLVFGFQNRLERGGNKPTTLEEEGESTGNLAQSTFGEYTENAGYVELGVPLLADLPGVELLEINAAVRVFNFDTFGTDSIYKVGGLWKIYSDLSLRGNVSRSFRAPNVTELFEGNVDAFPNVTDPCDIGSGLRNGVVATNCDALGVPQVNAGQTQLRAIEGGNQDLEPEEAVVLTGGVVWTPTFSELVKGFSLTVDYFSIDIDNAIQETGVPVILNNCYGLDTPDLSACALINRDGNGVITAVQNASLNIGGFDAEGIDISLRYTQGTDFGRLFLSFEGTLNTKYEATFADGNTASGLSDYTINQQFNGFMPEWTYVISGQWSYKGFGLGGNFRYVPPIVECQANDCDDDGGENRIIRPVEEFIRADVFGSYSFSTPLGYTALRAGINNVTGAEPPLVHQGFVGTDRANYSLAGRQFYVNLSHRL